MSPNTYDIDVFRPELGSDHEWARCHALRCREHHEQGTQVRSLAAYRAWHLETLGQQRNHWVARQGDEVVAKMELAVVRDDVGLLNVYVAPEARRQGIARAFLRRALTAAQERRVPILHVGARQACGWRVCERFAGQIVSSRSQRLLELSHMPRDTVQAWCKAGSERSPGTRIEEFAQLPEGQADAFFDLCERVSTELPQSGIQVPDRTLAMRRERERSYERLGCQLMTLVAADPHASLSGFTEVLYDPRDTELVHQLYTCVSPQQRGRGLAQWLKAAMLRSISARFPAALRVQTRNSDDNAAMLAINQRLGFGAALCDRMYQFDVAALARRLRL